MARLRSLLKNLLPLVILGICASLLWPRLAEVDGAEVAAHWAVISPLNWLAAGAFCAVSFWAVSQYDMLAHRHLGHNLQDRRARSSGTAAIALAQTTGFGPVIGTLVRWRLVPELGPLVAAHVTAFVAILFMASLCGFTALTCLFFPALGLVQVLSFVMLGLLMAAAIMCFVLPEIRLAGRPVRLPSLLALLHGFGWAALDVLAAAMAFFLVFPAGYAPDFVAFLPVFCLALAAGLLSGTPGGVGPFELVFLGYVGLGAPLDMSSAAAVTAIMGFRLIYFAVPAMLAGAWVLLHRPQPDRRVSSELRNAWQDAAPRAETGVIAQSGGAVVPVGRSLAALWPSGQALVCLFDPFTRPQPVHFFRALQRKARRENRLACVYKCGAQTARGARKMGWSVLHIADDALIDLGTFTLSSPSRARLRRKLRKASKAGINIRLARQEDLPQLAEIDRVWQQAHGRARGGTMGRFCPNYLKQQAVFVAERADLGRLVAFVTFHPTEQEWALDIMRHISDLPDGTMHALVTEGLDCARAAGAARVSLSAVPACPDPSQTFWRWAARHAVIRAGGPGLRQFKSAFAPRWMPLYAAAPSRIGLCVALLDIARAVAHPGPVQNASASQSQIDSSSGFDTWRSDNAQSYMKARHQNDEHYEVA